MGNKVEDSKNLATTLANKNLYVDYKSMFTSYVVPYSFNTGIFEGTQLNHPTYIPLGLVLMILNHICALYDSNGVTKVDRPMFYIDFNNKSNICLSNAKHLSVNPYDVLIPFQGTNDDFRSIIEPTVTGYRKDKADVWFIKPPSGSNVVTEIYRPRDKNADLLSGTILPFKIDGESKIEKYRGRTMNILVSCDYLLKIVSTYSKQNGSGDIYIREFVEQVLFDINKALGDVNIFRLAYDDGANTAYVVDDQMTPNLENSFSDSTNVSQIPIFGNRSIARNLEIRTEISSKLSNMLAISANSKPDEQANLSKNTESYGFYNLGYKDRYIPRRTEFTSSVVLPTDAMINSAIQFNKAIQTFYSDSTPADVSHATSYYIERMAKIKAEDKGTRASSLIPVNLNLTIDGMSGLGMGYSFTVPNEFLPYTYDLTNTNPFGESNYTNTVGFVMVGLDQTIENNEWLSNIRSNMLYLKKRSDFDIGSDYSSYGKLDKSTKSFAGAPPPTFIGGGGGGGGPVPDNANGCKRLKGVLDENIVESTIIKSAYGTFVKGKVSFIAALENAYNSLKAAGITLQIGDSYRSFESQRQAYENFLVNKELQKQGKSWVKNGKTYPPTQEPANIAHPCEGYHVQGQAVDLEQNAAQQTDILNNGPIYKALYNEGLRRIPNEWWHWSIGEVG